LYPELYKHLKSYIIVLLFIITSFSIFSIEFTFQILSDIGEGNKCQKCRFLIG